MWSRKKTQQAVRVLRMYGRPHVRVLVRGIVASVGVVLFRLALPWPLRGIVESVFLNPHRKNAFLLNWLPARGDPVLWFGGVFLVLAAGAGLCELIQRVAMKRFATQSVHDMRGAAARGALSRQAGSGAPAELIARVIGDSARIKAGLAGILVHVCQNGLLYLGVSALLMTVSVHLGIFFLGAGALAILIGLRASAPVAASAQRHRRKEDAYAMAIQQALELGVRDSLDDKVNVVSAQRDVETTRLISRSALAVHAVLAATLAGGLWFGAAQVRTAKLAPGDLFIFVAYVLTVHRRMVQVGRQLARSGKVLACARRIGQLMPPRPEAGPRPRQREPLRSVLRLEGVRLDSLRGRRHKPRLHRADLRIEAGTHVAVLGPMGSGKTSLLRLLAGLEPPSKGTLYWDDEPMSDADGICHRQIGYLSDYPVFASQPVWRILGLPGAESEPPGEMLPVLKTLGITKLVRRLPKGIRQKIPSATLSRAEARALSLVSILAGPDGVWILDDPLGGQSGPKKMRRQLAAILARGRGRTVIVGLPRNGPIELFDRVVVLRRGRIRFDGTPTAWKEAKECKP
ncbi:MAG: ABC transporter ATP-binding protein/permease [Planctomycetes bacterium]|nr:ABC transporter ATP-binding protein/permease [Planctomycetota bacterium]